MVPEISLGYTEEDDIYNIGLIAYHLITGSYFELEHVVNVKVVNCSRAIKEFLMCTLSQNPDHRSDIDPLLKHPVFNIFYTQISNYGKYTDFAQQLKIGLIEKKICSDFRFFQNRK